MSAMVTHDQLVRVMSARAVAVYGATDRAGSPGSRPLRYMQAAGFSGRLLPINPARTEVAGLRSFSSLEQAAVDDVDLAMILVPAADVPAAVEDCAGAGVAVAVIESAGFGEVGGAGRLLQEQLCSSASAADMRVLGPNCLGLMVPDVGVYATGTAAIDGRMPTHGSISVVTQSGAVGAAMLSELTRRRLGIRFWASTGNEADLHAADLIQFAVEEGRTAAMLLYLEAVRDVERLTAALAMARDNELPIVAVRSGRSDSGGRAIASHTGAMASPDRLYDALFAEYGVLRAHTLRTAVDAIHLLSNGIPAGANSRVAIISASGGLGAIAADAADDHGIDLAAISHDTQAAIASMLPGSATTNPIDGTGRLASSLEMLEHLVNLVTAEKEVDVAVILLGHVLDSPAYAPKLEAVVETLRKGAGCPLVVVGSEATSGTINGLHVVAESDDLFAALQALRGAAHRDDAPVRAEDRIGIPSHVRTAAVSLPMHTAMELIATSGVDMVPWRSVSDASAIDDVVRELGLPLALKLSGANLDHKTDLGGVRVNLSSIGEVREAFEQLDAVRRSVAPAAVVVAQPMLANSVGELIVGGFRDAVLGPHVLVGAGGVLSELIGDSVVRRVPVSAADARSMLSALRSSRLFDGYRNQPRGDLDAVGRAVCGVSDLLMRRPDIREVEVNPLIVRVDGATGVDGLVAIDSSNDSPEGDPR